MYKQRVQTILDAITKNGTANDSFTHQMVDMTRDALINFGDYVHAVYSMEAQMGFLKFQCEPEEFRERVQELDSRRRHCHDATISNLAIVNRMAERNNVAPLFDGKLADRYAVGDFCMDIVKEYFDDRSGREQMHDIDVKEYAKKVDEEHGFER